MLVDKPMISQYICIDWETHFMTLHQWSQGACPSRSATISITLGSCCSNLRPWFSLNLRAVRAVTYRRTFRGWLTGAFSLALQSAVVQTYKGWKSSLQHVQLASVWCHVMWYCDQWSHDLGNRSRDHNNHTVPLRKSLRNLISRNSNHSIIARILIKICAFGVRDPFKGLLSPNSPCHCSSSIIDIT